MKRFGCRLAMVVLALSSAKALRGQTYEVLHYCEPPGPVVANELIVGSDGAFYGSSVYGGPVDHPNCPVGCGSVFRIDGDGVVTTLHEFIRDENGNSPDGFYPEGRLLLASNGDLYGTTLGGGSETNACGTVFRIDSSGIFTTVHRFEGPDGCSPEAGLTEPQPGDLWGVAGYGGDYECSKITPGCGTIFRMHFNGDLETMHVFSLIDGIHPLSALVLGDDGNLYGTTTSDGPEDDPGGTAFRITQNGNLTVIHAFTYYYSPVTISNASGGYLVGVGRLDGGPKGSVFRMTLDGDVETLHAFAADGHEGSQPHAAILQADDGYFYGTTQSGGTNNLGTVFQLGENGGFTTIHEFADPEGSIPVERLLQAGGRLFGTTSWGGIGAAGVVYRITLPGPPPRYYCPSNDVRRDQMAAFLLKIEHGAAYVPPDCAGQFPDVACPSLFANWIEQLATEGVTAGCGGGDYCPLSPITRAQMAVFLLKNEHGAAYTPPDCAGIFPDVPCPSTFAAWIEQLAAEGITAGCAGGNFCPDFPVTRAQMAVFLLKIEHGSAFAPPACKSVFTDVACPSQFANWVETLYAEQITAGCAGPP